ncbi:putative crinkler (CRN) family protein [Phytophthora cinnamomi]|uniref:putative crinkler (CRN) family protein n=1 Tax=Phytophthora cinnamomi TaxID=4785 RepID=UPI002B2BD6A0
MPGTKVVAYVVIGHGLLFTVRAENYARVSYLAQLIKETSPSIITCEATSLTLYLAKKSDGWLKESDPDARRLIAGELPPGAVRIMNDENKMGVLRRVDDAAFGFPDIEEEEVDEDVIHVLVWLFRGCNSSSTK